MEIRNVIRNIFLNPKSFFLENLGIKQTIIKNTFWLAVGEGVTRLLKLILIIYIARILGATEYGKFTFALAFVSLFVIFSDFGLSSITTRELSREKEREKEFSSIFSLKILLSLGTLILILVSSFFITPNPLIQKAIWILGIYILVSNFSAIIYAFFQARQKMEYESWAKILQAIVLTTFGFFVILNFPSVQNLSYSYLFASLVALIFILIFFHLKVFSLKISWQKSIWRRFLGMSWPLALAGAFGLIYSYIDSIMMGHWGQITQTGWYNAAFKVAAATSIPMVLISQSFYPALSIAFKESKERLQKVWNYQMEMMILLAIPIVIGGIVLAPKIIDFIYDPSYFSSILAFQILIIMAGLVFLCNPLNRVLVASNQQRKIFWVALGGAVVNVILNLILIPRYSLYGAAVATVITYSILFLLLTGFTRRFTPIYPLNLKFLLTGIIAIFSSSVMGVVILQPLVYNLNVILSILIGALIYVATFLILKFGLKYFKKLTIKT